jgi:hypothetical protein
VKPPRHRATGLLRSLSTLRRRAGIAGLVELCVARAFPGILSYERAVIVATPLAGGRLRPELAPRRLRSSEPAIDEFHARLAATREPEVPAFSPDALRRRFEEGYELWVFHLGGQIAHARWVVSGRRRFPGGSIPLRSDERASEAVVTAAEFRGRGLAWAARDHVRAELSAEGVSTMFSAPSGFNRGFLVATLRSSGAERVATMHLVSVGRRRWLRAAPGSPSQAELLERRGLAHSRWVAVRAQEPGRELDRGAKA